MLKIAVVGTGIIGLDHLKAIEMSKNLRLVAVCDVNEDKVRSVAKEYEVPYFLDYKEIPEKTDAEAVILNLPHGIHCESAVFFLNAGLHVLLEKPMANTVEECDKMIAAEKQSGKKLAIGHIQRFLNANRIAKDYIASGKIGKLCMITELRSIDYFKPERPRWFFDKKLSGGGIVMNYGAHALDKFFYVTGERVLDICAHSANVKNSEEIEGHAQFFAKMTGGISVSVSFSGYSSVGYETMYIGTAGAIKVTSGVDVYVMKNGVWTEIPGANDGLHMLRQLEEFEKFVHSEENEMPTSEYGKTVISGIEKIYSESGLL